MLTEMLGFSAGIICIMYRGSGPGGVQNSDYELPESIICIMFRGSGPGCVQGSSSEHLRGPIYYKLHRMETKSTVDFEWKPSGNRVGRRERRAGGTLISSENCRYLQYLQEYCYFDTPRPPMGAADYLLPRCRRPIVGWSAWCAGE